MADYKGIIERNNIFDAAQLLVAECESKDRENEALRVQIGEMLKAKAVEHEAKVPLSSTKRK